MEKIDYSKKKKEIIEDYMNTFRKWKILFPGKEFMTRNFFLENGTTGYNYQSIPEWGRSIYKLFKEVKDLYPGEFKINIPIQENKNNKSKETSETDLKTQKTIFVLKQEIETLKKQKLQFLKKYVLEEEIISLYKEELKNFNPSALNISTKEIIPRANKNNIALMNFSDWHVGEVVIADEINDINEFNKDIFVIRCDRIFEKLINNIVFFDIQKLHLNFLGDLVTGTIHEELVENSDMSIVESLFFLEDYILSKLSLLSNYVNEIEIDWLVGNHGRFSKKPIFKKKGILNWEYILGRQIEQLLLHINSPKIKIKVSKSPFTIIDINSTKFFITHGDIFRGGSGGFAGIPFYSLAQSSAKFYGMLSHVGLKVSAPFKHVITGHLHTSCAMPIFTGGKFYINACIIGSNEYSISEVKVKSMIEQLLLIVDQNGKVDYEINLRGLEK